MMFLTKLSFNDLQDLHDNHLSVFDQLKRTSEREYKEQKDIQRIMAGLSGSNSL